MMADTAEKAVGKRPAYYRPIRGHEEDWFDSHAINDLATEYEDQGVIPGGWLGTLVWNIRNSYLWDSEAERVFSARQMQMVVEGFMAEVEAWRSCANRLRSGWRPGEGFAVRGQWLRGGDVVGDITSEDMTQSERRLMALTGANEGDSK